MISHKHSAGLTRCDQGGDTNLKRKVKWVKCQNFTFVNLDIHKVPKFIMFGVSVKAKLSDLVFIILKRLLVVILKHFRFKHLGYH